MELLKSGRTLLLRRFHEDKGHAWFVLTDPEPDPGRFVAVMLRTPRYFTDETLILELGEHPFIKHRSCVHYSTADFFNSRYVSRGISQGTCHFLEDMSSMLLKKVREGLLLSPRTVNAVKEYCRTRF